MSESYSVYKHTSPSGKIYIGITKQQPKRRWQNGLGYCGNIRFFNAIKKYGWDNIKHEVVWSNLSKEKACELEKLMIEKYKSDHRNHGYNVSPGGYVQSEESLQKQRETAIKKGLYEQSKKRALNMWRDPEKRKEITEAMQNKPRTEEQKENYKAASAYRVGVPLPEETKTKLSKIMSSKTGENAIRKQEVYQIDTRTGEIVHTYATSRLAAREFNKSINSIANCCRSKNKCCEGYFWCYAKDYTPEMFNDVLGITLNKSGKIAKIGERNSSYGKKHTKEAKLKMSKAHSKSVICIETGQAFDSVKKAGAWCGIGGENISRQISGKVNKAGGYTWRYA